MSDAGKPWARLRILKVSFCVIGKVRSSATAVPIHTAKSTVRTTMRFLLVTKLL
jgi:hypothetical protein